MKSTGAAIDEAYIQPERERRKRRHKRPNKAQSLDETLPMFEGLAPLIWCPYGEGHHAAPSDFHKNTSRPSGLSTYCKACRKLVEKKYRRRAGKKNVVREMRRLGKRIERAVERVLKALADERAQ